MQKVFVNRKYELERLDSFLKEAHGGSPTFVFISGEAGVGKADLVYHFYDLNEEDIVPFYHGATQEQSTVPYNSFTHFLERFSQMDERDLGEEAAARLTKIQGMLGSQSTLVGDVGKEREVLFEAFCQFFQSVSRERTISLFIQNFQWSDEGSILLVQHLAQYLEGCRLLFIADYRPEELEETEETVHPITGLMATLMMQDKLNTLIVERFGIEATEELLSVILGTDKVPEIFVNFIFERTEGSPMYINALVGNMTESGVIDLKRPHWAEEFDPDKVKTPGGVNDIISRRLDHVGDELHEVLKVASVIGSEFTVADLAAVTGRSPSELSKSMAEVVERQIIYEELEASEETYVFDHSKIREVLYESVELGRRKELHARIGDILETRNRPLEYAYALARHFTEAGDSFNGYRYSRLSGDLAVGSHAPTEAFGYYNSALRLITGTEMADEIPEERVELLIVIGEIGYVIGKWDEAIMSLENAVISARELGNDLLIASSLIALGDIIRFKAVNNPRSIQMYTEALEISEKAGFDDLVARAHRGMGYICWREGRFEEAESHYKVTIAKSEKTGNRRLLGSAHTELGNLNSSKGDLVGSVREFDIAIEILSAENDFYELARAHNNLGDSYLQRGEWDKAIEVFDRCGEIAGEFGLKDFQGWALFNAAEALAKKGELDLALDNCERAKVILTKLNDKVGLEGIEKNLGTIYRFKKDWEKSEEHFGRSNAMTEEMGFPHSQTEVLVEWGAMYLDKGDKSRAKEVLEKAVEIAIKIEAKEIELKAKALMKDGGLV